MENHFLGVNLIPDNEAKRLAALRHYDILGTPPEGAFNYIAEVTAHLFKVPIALVSLVDAEQVWFKANVGMPGVQHIARGTSLCSLAILSPEPTVFQNALDEPCLLVNPLVTGNFGLRFYAAAPLTTSDGLRLGALCIVDKQPREFSAADQKILGNLAQLVMDEIELHYLRRKVGKQDPADEASPVPS